MCHCVSGFSQEEIASGKFPWIRQKEQKNYPLSVLKVKFFLRRQIKYILIIKVLIIS